MCFLLTASIRCIIRQTRDFLNESGLRSFIFHGVLQPVFLLLNSKKIKSINYVKRSNFSKLVRNILKSFLKWRSSQCNRLHEISLEILSKSTRNRSSHGTKTCFRGIFRSLVREAGFLLRYWLLEVQRNEQSMHVLRSASLLQYSTQNLHQDLLSISCALKHSWWTWRLHGSVPRSCFNV